MSGIFSVCVLFILLEESPAVIRLILLPIAVVLLYMICITIGI